MENKKIVLWFIGGNAVGKTTQGALIHDFFKKDKTAEPKIISWLCDNGIKHKDNCYTSVSNISANLGRYQHPLILPPNSKYEPLECSGTDLLHTKRQIQESFEEAIKHHKIVIVEGIMATGQWHKFLKRPDTIVILVHLKIDMETNVERLIKRQLDKRPHLGTEHSLREKTVENLERKHRIFEGVWNNSIEFVDYSVELDGTLPIEVIHEKILSLVFKASELI